MKNLLYRPVIAITMLLGLLLLSELTALSVLTLRNLHRIETIETHLSYSDRLRELGASLERFMLERPLDTRVMKAQYEDIQLILQSVEHYRSMMSERSKQQLDQLWDIVHKAETGGKHQLLPSLTVIRLLQARQMREEARLLENIYSDTELEFKFAIGVPVVVISLVLLSGQFFLRRHILNPLDNLKELVSKLADGEFSPIETDNLDPVLLPLFSNYNLLVRRLAELEEKHQTHTNSLEREVRRVTRTLLEQSRSLARAERLAAVGELAASTAHELRNPLAGIQVALENLRRECDDADHAERFELITSELRRLAKRLNDLLASSEHTPESSKKIDFKALVDDLFALLRYQIDETIQLEAHIEPGLDAFLPEIELRQALLNLTLNATQALAGKRGTVKICARRGGENLLISVCDDGPGFPPALLQGGVRPFTSYREGGTGLGLLMVQRFAHNLGGKLRLENREAETCAMLMLPCNGPYA